MKVEKEKITCDRLGLDFSNLEEAKKMLDTTQFSFTQKFSTTKKSGVMSASYYTCDNEKGFLWITVNGRELIYKEVPHFKWKGLIETNDLDGYYDDQILGKFLSAIKSRN